MTNRFNPGDMDEGTKLQDVDIDDDDHVSRLRNRIYLSVTDSDKAKWNRNDFMVQQTWGPTDDIGAVADDVRSGIAAARSASE
jgi:hypothetical protein